VFLIRATLALLRAHRCRNDAARADLDLDLDLDLEQSSAAAVAAQLLMGSSANWLPSCGALRTRRSMLTKKDATSPIARAK
jgi:hypothetical protein